VEWRSGVRVAQLEASGVTVHGEYPDLIRADSGARSERNSPGEIV